ncbi:hypothetical protein C366_04617 [Cryptococcus neoformans Tu401-1]|nr:hypothetical protein C356_04505 [Cryptococcus neoformans var. grubii c45]OWZ67291.1 hypothetical protein AYX15_01594 [Cryptococcus neoformans var. grubii]OWZ77072.1 hypothetical protein C365_04330 [Cryptococcus neoformans var. grubii Bt85]OXG14575.1 hypothetical protein C366_04617 [Cryptococcus neoformans var. grubii Tu401-1]OXM77662.1 hypothetical protein C364_04601 [Cryptococcus neoformans var. grubii Bt63]
MSPTVKKLPPPAPPKQRSSAHPSALIHPSHKAPTVPLKPLQGVSKTRGDAGKAGHGRECIFVTRKTALGALMGRCRSLVVDEGYTSLTLYALGPAISHALLLLHALLDLLPYPKGEKGMWYEIRTGSVECVDEVDKMGNNQTDENNAGQEEDAWLKDVGSVEASAPERTTRIKSSIEITIHIAPRPASKSLSTSREKKKKNRPSKKTRMARWNRLKEEERMREEEEEEEVEEEEGDEEATMNA